MLAPGLLVGTERRMFRSVRVGCGTYKVLQQSQAAATRALAQDPSQAISAFKSAGPWQPHSAADPGSASAAAARLTCRIDSRAACAPRLGRSGGAPLLPA